jgi:hypothetical protein
VFTPVTSSTVTSSWTTFRQESESVAARSMSSTLVSPRSTGTQRPLSYPLQREQEPDWYCSLHFHQYSLGCKQARRDDLESLAYVLMYFLRGSLPWQGLEAATKKQKYDRIMEKKMTTPSDLCRGFPNGFAIFLSYIQALRFDDKPNYSYSRKLFRDLFAREGASRITVLGLARVEQEGERLFRGKTLLSPGAVTACEMMIPDRGPVYPWTRNWSNLMESTVNQSLWSTEK